jgi:hypothetical protein
LWATAVMALLLLGAIRTLNFLVTRASLLSNHLLAALGEQPGPATRIQLSADGRSLLVSGGINDDTAEKLQRTLNQAAGVQTMVLTSKGGWVGQGGGRSRHHFQ